jgi:hypothetical protein
MRLLTHEEERHETGVKSLRRAGDREE